MSVDTVVAWLLVGAWIVVLLLVAVVALPQAIGQARRIVKRLAALESNVGLRAMIATAQANVERIERASDRLPALEQRARAATEAIRDTPVVPPALSAAAVQVRAQVRAFQDAAR